MIRDTSDKEPIVARRGYLLSGEEELGAISQGDICKALIWA
jgi:hypothetical protein